MTITYNDGKVYSNGIEITKLTSKQQDELILLLYPKEIKTMADISRHSTSIRGKTGWNLNQFEQDIDYYVETNDCYVANNVYSLGGVRLYTLYCNKFDFVSSANDLGLTYNTLHKWFQRWKRKAIAKGITAKDIFN